jgi:hypothetical protein
MNFIGTIQKGEFVPAGRQSELRKRFLSSMKDGTVVKEGLVKQTLPKTYQQCKTHFGLALAMIVEGFNDLGWDCSVLLNLPNPTGIGINKDMLQQYFYALFPIFDESGKQTTLSGMTTIQASNFFDQIRNWTASQWGFSIPDPDPNWRKEKKCVS